MTLVCKSVGIWDGIVNPIYGCGVKMASDINPIYAGLALNKFEVEGYKIYLWHYSLKLKKCARRLQSLLFSLEFLNIVS